MYTTAGQEKTQETQKILTGVTRLGSVSELLLHNHHGGFPKDRKENGVIYSAFCYVLNRTSDTRSDFAGKRSIDGGNYKVS